MKETEANIVISASHGTGGSFVHFEISDERSGQRILDLEIPFEAWGKAVAGISYQKCKARLIAVDGPRIGLTRQTVKAVLEFDREKLPREHEARRDFIEALANERELDGWRALVDSAMRCQQNNPRGFEVWYERYLDKDGNSVEV